MTESQWPRHVGIIMDGNGRWAQSRGWKRLQGHMQGADKVISIIEAVLETEIKTLSLFCFSTENWKRPITEIQVLMDLMYKFLDKQLQRLITNNVRVRVLGDMDKAPSLLREKLKNCVEITQTNNGLNLNFMMSYGGRDDILQATRKLSEKVLSGEISIEDINENTFSKALHTSELDDPDLIIRTSGEFRISNFMLWQAAYSEFYVSPKFWPDFTKKTF
ncbi:MAG: polyprenyl diphosphate synthase [Bdellovibrionota bacterium]